MHGEFYELRLFLLLEIFPRDTCIEGHSSLESLAGADYPYFFLIFFFFLPSLL